MTAPPDLLGRPSRPDLVLLGIAVLGIGFSAPLITAIAAPALAIALWRNVLGGAALLPYALARHRGDLRRLAHPPQRRLILLAGVALAVHFATWIPAVTLTTVASATALGATQPVWNALIARLQGHAIPARAWAGIATAVAGAVVLTGVDVTVSGRALLGDLLALVGGMAAAVYVALGARVRATTSVTAYSSVCYLLCAVLLLGVCLVGRVDLGPYDTQTWALLVALTVAAQLVGHTILNRVVATVGPIVVALFVLLEVPAATVIAAAWLGQTPPLAAIPAALLVLAGVALVVTSEPAASPAPDDVP